MGSKPSKGILHSFCEPPKTTLADRTTFPDRMIFQIALRYPNGQETYSLGTTVQYKESEIVPRFLKDSSRRPVGT
jgi:hypothetical protein